MPRLGDGGHCGGHLDKVEMVAGHRGRAKERSIGNDVFAFARLLLLILWL